MPKKRRFRIPPLPDRAPKRPTLEFTLSVRLRDTDLARALKLIAALNFLIYTTQHLPK